MRHGGTDIDHAARVLADGGLVAFPTETVYGLGADATNAVAVAKVFAAKGRPKTHPLIAHLSVDASLRDWVAEVPPHARQLASEFWPGPLTLILRRTEAIVPDVTGGATTVAVRVPSHPMAQALLRRFGRPVAAPSANPYGRVSSTTASHVAEDLGSAVDYLLDDGPCLFGVESTIVDVTGSHPVLLRPGAIPRAAIEAALGAPLLDRTSESPAAPGVLPSHYAPRARLVAVPVVDLAATIAASCRPVVVLARPSDLALCDVPVDVRVVLLPDDLDQVAHRLYATLRSIDDASISTIVAALPPLEGLGETIADRLRRAAGPRSR